MRQTKVARMQKYKGPKVWGVVFIDRFIPFGTLEGARTFAKDFPVDPGGYASWSLSDGEITELFVEKETPECPSK
jgi:hypothetical protein